jgi:hypothetical protein
MESEILTSFRLLVTSNNYYYKKKKRGKRTVVKRWTETFNFDPGRVRRFRSGKRTACQLVQHVMNLPLSLSPREKIP